MSKDIVKQIRRATRRKFMSEEKIRIVLEGLRGEVPITDLCRREAITPALYYKWSKDFLDAGKNGLTKNTKRGANTDEVRNLREENNDLKRGLAEAVLEVQRLKKSLGM